MNVVELYKLNPTWSCQQLGSILGISRQRVHKVLKEEGLTPKPPPDLHKYIKISCGYCGRITGLTPWKVKWRLKESKCGIIFCSRKCAGLYKVLNSPLAKLLFRLGDEAIKVPQNINVESLRRKIYKLRYRGIIEFKVFKQNGEYWMQKEQKVHIMTVGDK